MILTAWRIGEILPLTLAHHTVSHNPHYRLQPKLQSPHTIHIGKRKVYSRLWDIKKGVDWMTMCKTTPIKISGHTFLHPDKCDDKGVLGAYGGEIGHYTRRLILTVCTSVVCR